MPRHPHQVPILGRGRTLSLELPQDALVAHTLLGAYGVMGTIECQVMRDSSDRVNR